MMFDSQHVGVAIPLNVRGRGTMTGMDDRPREVQFLYTPDPRRARTRDDAALLDALRPAKTLWPRRTIELPPAAEVAEALQGKKTSLEWEQLMRASLAPFDPSTDSDDDEDADDHRARDTEVERGAADGMDDEVDQAQDRSEGYGEPSVVGIEAVEVGDLIRFEERGPWVCVEQVEYIGPSDGGQVQFDWRDDDDNAGEQLIGVGELAEVRRPVD